MLSSCPIASKVWVWNQCPPPHLFFLTNVHDPFTYSQNLQRAIPQEAKGQERKGPVDTKEGREESSTCGSRGTTKGEKRPLCWPSSYVSLCMCVAYFSHLLVWWSLPNVHNKGTFCRTFDLDAFKRSYSNEKDTKKAVAHFWENFEKEGWSIWRCKYAEDLSSFKIFMCSNLVSGMLQRLEKLRKTAFASILIVGEDNNVSIEGVWVMRGQKPFYEVCKMCRLLREIYYLW